MPLSHTDLIDLASQLFVQKFAQASGSSWDFEPLAQKAFDAAHAFSRVADKVMAPQVSTPPPIVAQTQAQTPPTPPVPPTTP